MKNRSHFLLLPGFLVVMLLVMLMGCAGQQETVEQTELPPDTTGFYIPEREPVIVAPADTLPSMEELERRRLEARRLEEEKRREQMARDKDRLRTIHFALDQASLSSDTRDDVRFNAELLSKYPDWSIVIEGHCDERGSTEYNLALGERRAATVAQYYADFGIPRNRMELISYGEERPAVQGSGEAVWAKNRRAVTLVH